MLYSVLILGGFLVVAVAAFSNTDLNDRPRLPQSVVPNAYRLEVSPHIPARGIQLNPARANSFDGRVLINATVKTATDTIELDAKDLVLQQVSVFDQQIRLNLSLYPVDVDYKWDRVRIRTEKQISENTEIIIEIKYIGRIRNDDNGFHVSAYANVSMEHQNLVYATHFEPYEARTAFPCFDEPAFKANFSVVLTVPETMTALSNGEVVSITSLNDGKKIVEFETTEAISTYLLAFGFGNLTSVEGKTATGITTRIWSHADHAGLLDTALTGAIACTDALTEYTQMPLTIKKIDHFGVGKMPGAMENYGLITYGYNSIIFNPIQSKLNAWLSLLNIQCHELAHHWFGDLVTNAWWGDLFLHESFATYFSTVAAQIAFPNEKEFLDTYFKTNSESEFNLSKNALHAVVADNAEFDAITYWKGGQLLRQLSFTLGADVLQEGLRFFLKTRKYGIATHEDLYSALEVGISRTKGKNLLDWCHRPLTYSLHTYLQAWFEQLYHPRLDVSFDVSRNVFVVRQSADSANATGERWPMLLFVNRHNRTEPTWFAPGYECGGEPLSDELVISGDSVPALLLDPRAENLVRIVYDEHAMKVLKMRLADYSVDLLPQSAVHLLVDNKESFRSAADLDLLLSYKSVRRYPPLIEMIAKLMKRTHFPNIQRNNKVQLWQN